MRDYTKIVAWQKADDLTVAIYRATCGFPKEEIYSLTSQLRRAAYSVPANIVEGSARDSKKDYLHFLYIARGSLSETRYFLHLSRRLEYITETDYLHSARDADEVSRVLHGLITSVEVESGKIAKIAARVTSLLVMSLTGAILRHV
jgi:four helix bundle protein